MMWLVMTNLPETTFAILGLLDKRVSSGYDLAAFADRSLAYFWPISRTLVYRELERLEALGWVRAEIVLQDRLPDKRVWSTTPEGRRALLGWLAQPVVVAGSGNRNAFLLKFFLGARMPAEAVRALLDDYRASLQLTRADLSAIVEHLAGNPHARFGRLTALHGLRTAEARLAWIDAVEAELAETLQPQTADETDLFDALRTPGHRERRAATSRGAPHVHAASGHTTSD